MAANAVVDGRYRIIRRLGAGGMAEVWCAEDTQLHRKVALKILQRRFAQDHEFVERFRREASAAAGLQHPNVVNVFDRGEVDGTYYIAMEYVEGASLRDLINKGMSVEAAVGVCRQILTAARFAHSNGVIHRDLKPGNVLIDRNGRATVTDFGIAKAGASEITQTGSVMGTAQYLSPEQAQGLEVTAASDLYSVGVILYEALTGKVPFEADSAVAVALKQVSEAPRPPSELNPAVPKALDAVVLKALAKDPRNRFASADEFEAALDAAAANPSAAPVETAIFAAAPVGAPQGTEVRGPAAPPPEESPEAEPRRRWWRWVLVGLLAAALVGAAAWALTRPAQVTVPAVISEREDEARAVLEEAGLEVETTRVSADRRAGTVLEQDPRAGERAERGSTVLLTVSQGPGFAEVPAVEGRRERRAAELLEEEGFLVDSEGRPSGDVAAGRAIGTEPEEGTRVARGETVTLFVSEGPELVDVPLVVGQSQQSAEARLREEDFIVSVSTESSEEPRGTVIAQNPAGGTAERGSVVRIVVSTGAESVVVDSVLGQSQPAARATLRAQGLRVTARREDVESARDHGVVIEQTPPAATRVPRGTTVTLVVGRFRDPGGDGR